MTGLPNGCSFQTGKFLWVFETLPFENCDRCSVTPSLPYGKKLEKIKLEKKNTQIQFIKHLVLELSIQLLTLE